MFWLRLIYSRLYGLLRKDRIEQEMDDEMRFHLLMRTRENIERGMRPEEAEREARRRFGNVGRIKDLARDIKGGGFMETLLQDLRYGTRVLLKNPGFSLVAIFTLALGIGANTTIFSAVNAILLRPLPYPEPERLVLVSHRNSKRGNDELTPASYYALRRQSKSFEQIAVYASRDLNLTGRGEPERLSCQFVSAALFPLLKVNPGVGRVFTEAEDRAGAPRVVLLSHELWQQRFGAAADVVGQAITLDDQAYTVVGVMPPGFEFPTKGISLWAPIAFNAYAQNENNAWFLNGIARLSPGVTMAQAQSEVDIVGHNLARDFPQTHTNVGFGLVPLHESLVSSFKQALAVLFGAVLFVLLIACVNVANLLLARMAAREKELAVRAALGAGRLRLLRQLLTESALLALCGGALGLLLGVWGIEALQFLNPDGPGAIARLEEVSLDWRVFGFTLGVSCLTSVLFSLAPALQISKTDLQVMLKEGGRGFAGTRGQRLRKMLVIAEVALSLVLLVAAGLLIRSLVRLQQVDLGFNSEHMLTLRVEMSVSKAQKLANITNFYQQALDRVRTLPGVRAVSVATAAPIATPGMGNSLVIEDKPDPPPGQSMSANNRVVSPDYFQTLGIPLLKGRLLTAQDTTQTPFAVVINQALARAYWGDEDPIGKRIKLIDRQSSLPWMTVVGVVGSIRQKGPSQDPYPEFYTPFTQEHQFWARPSVLLIRAAGDPLSLAAAVKSQIWAVDKDQTITAVQTMEEIVAQWLAPRRFNLWLLGFFAALALALASVGIYGVVSYAVSQRTREIGIRMALGARTPDVLKLVVTQGMKPALAGVAIGLAISFGLTRLIRNLLFEVSATDPPTFVAITLVLTAIGLLACWIPARRATKVDPMVALRAE
jgi:putative ABC transport system permease protein